MSKLISPTGQWSQALTWAANIAAGIVLLILLPIAIHAYRTRPRAAPARPAASSAIINTPVPGAEAGAGKVSENDR